MMTLITNLLPIMLGFFSKLLAIKMKASSENHRLMIEAMSARNSAINSARDYATKESPMSALNRRVLIFTILGLVALYPISAVFLDVETVVPVLHKGASFLGIQLTEDTTEFVTVSGLIKFEEIFQWCTLIVEFYVGSQAAKA